MKLWATAGQEDDYDWGELSAPYLDLKGENALEPLGALVHVSTAYAVSVTLLKIRILFDLQALKGAAVIGQKVPREIFDNICSHMVGNIVAQRQDIMDGENLDQLIKDLQEQVLHMYQAVEKENKYFWPALLEPGSNMWTRPESFTIGSEEEMQLVLQYSYVSWAESPGAIFYISKLMKGINA